MKYILLAYWDEKLRLAMSSREHAALESARLANEQELRESGYLFAVERLQTDKSAVTVNFVNGRVSITGDSICSPQGSLNLLYFINARDLNEAIRVAAKISQAQSCPVEIRPLAAFA